MNENTMIATNVLGALAAFVLMIFMCSSCVVKTETAYYEACTKIITEAKSETIVLASNCGLRR